MCIRDRLNTIKLIFLFSNNRFTSLHHAALLGDAEVIASIIEMGGDVNVKDKKGRNICF